MWTCQTRLALVIQHLWCRLICGGWWLTLPWCFLAVMMADLQTTFAGNTARELQCGKLRLRPSVQAQARVFAAPKQTEHRQRKIWDGAFLSAAAADPPPPYRLANPSSFLDLVVKPGENLYMSKRDASTYFDTLQVPGPLQPWFGQAPITVQELTSLGFSRAKVTAFIDGVENCRLAPDSLLFPVNVVWPMGFSWSPCVAQASSVGCVVKAGVSESQILSLDHEMPQQQDELCVLFAWMTCCFSTRAEPVENVRSNE